MSEEKNNYYFIKFLGIVFIFFTIIYFANESVYYDYKMYKKTSATASKIDEFENDISKGSDLSLKNYVLKEEDYSSITSNVGYSIGNNIEKFFNLGIKKTLKYLSGLFYE